MDDLFLYNHIKKAIKQRKKFSKDTDEQNFAESYCRRQLMKKKLNCNTSNSNAKNKMKSLMKNFSHVETYVDLNELLYSINAIRTKELAERKISQIHEKHRQSKILRIQDIQNLNKPTLSGFGSEAKTRAIDPIEALKDKFRGEINERIKRRFQVENSEMNEIVRYLEKETHLNNSLLKNNSTNYLSYLNQELEKIQKNEDLEGDASVENQKIFRQLTQSISHPQFEKEPKTGYFKSTNLNSKQKKEENQLLHKISTFLQIALENEHKEKWATKDIKKFRSTHGSFRFKKNKDERSKFFLKGIDLQNNEEKQKQIFDKIHEGSKSPKVSKKSTLRRNQNIMRKIKSEQRNIFGKNLNDRANNPFNQMSQITDLGKKSSQWNPYEGNTKEPHKNSIFLKSWDNNLVEQRKTAPVDHDTLFEDFAQTMKSDFDEKFNQRNEDEEKKETPFDVFKPKKDYQLNKKRQSRQYNFITQFRSSQNYKTLIINPKKECEVEKKLNTTCKESLFKEIDNIPSISRQQLTHTQAQPKKPNTVVTDPSLSSVPSPSLKKSISTKSNLLSQTFTFKKRGKKQQIINKLQSFIEQINNEQKLSKMQNEYYDSAINHLHDLSKTTYKNYEPEALAGQEEISELKKFVNAINPSLRKNRTKKGVK